MTHAAETNVPKRWTRREFGFVAVGGLLTVAGYTFRSIFEDGARAVWWKSDAMRDLALREIHGPVHPDEVSLLFPDADLLSIFVSPNHPEWRRGLHPDNLEPAFRFVRALWDLDSADEVVNRLNDPRKRHILAMGEVTSDDMAREVFPSFTRPNNNPAGLPVTYALPQGGLRIRRHVGGESYSSWQRGITRPRKGTLYMPMDSQGWQEQDYLVVTSLPNFQNENAFDTGGRLVVVGGVHGMGTQAFPMVFTDEEIRNRFVPLLEDHEYFQAVFHIPYIHHDEEARVSQPKAILFKGVEGEDFFPLERGRLCDRLAHLVPRQVGHG